MDMYSFPRSAPLVVIVTLFISLSGCVFSQRVAFIPGGHHGCAASTCAYTVDIALADCNGRQLTCLPMSFNQAIIMDMGQNNIQRLPKAMLIGYMRLSSLDLSNNIVSVIEDNAFSALKALRTLTLSFNRITRLGIASFRGLRSLQILRLQGNSIMSIHADTFTGLMQMQDLILAGNRLTSLPDSVFSPLVNLRRLMLQENQLRTGNRFLHGLKSLLELDLDGNKFNALPDLSGLRMLGDLEITDSNIQRIRNNSFSDCGRIKELILASNAIDTIETEGLSGLITVTDLHLSFNSLNTLPETVFSKLVFLERLFLQNNVLTSLTASHFATLTRLRALYLGNNQLAMFPLLPVSRSLSILSLTSNNLSTFPQDVIVSLPGLRRLMLLNNPLQCDCRLKFLRQWFLNSGRAHRINELPQCDVPTSLSRQRLTVILASELTCTPPTVWARSSSVGGIEGHNITLDCSGTGGLPSPTITWRSPSNQELIPDVLSGRYLVTDDGPLLIIKATVADRGLFTCVGSNPAGTATAPVELNIQSNPNIPVPTASTGVINPPTYDVTSSPTFNNSKRPITNRVDLTMTPVQPAGKITPYVSVIPGQVDPEWSPKLPDSKEEDLNHYPTVCNAHPTKVVVGILLTFFMTCVLCTIFFWSWYHRLLPSFMRRPLNLSSLKNSRLSRNIVPARSRSPMLYSQMSNEGVYMRPTSLSESNDSASTGSFEHDNRYVITESITGKEGILKRKTLFNKLDGKSSGVSSGSQHTYINANLVVNDSNYTALCTGKDGTNSIYPQLPAKQQQHRPLPTTEEAQCSRAQSADSRIYMDLS